MTRKNETQHWIREKGREKFSDTQSLITIKKFYEWYAMSNLWDG